ncbi:MAG: hypothetical protein WD802_04175 [Gemmatimonadaceae bacterium]
MARIGIVNPGKLSKSLHGLGSRARALCAEIEAALEQLLGAKPNPVV